MSNQYPENIKTDLFFNDLISEISEDENISKEGLPGIFANSFENSFPFNARINEDNEDKDFKNDEYFYYYTKDGLEPNTEKSFIGMKETNSETKKEVLVMEKSPLTFEKSVSMMEKLNKDQNSHLNEKCVNELNLPEDKLTNPIFTLKKRGRQAQRCSNIEIVNNKVHDKNSKDNLLRKILISFFNFCISYSNDILKEFNYDEKFLKLTHDFKNQVKNDFIESLKDKTLYEIIYRKITSKYKTRDENTNIIIYDKIKENEVLKKIFDENFLVLFDIYYKGQKTIDLKKYGLEKKIHLSNKTTTFKDLLKKYESDQKYIQNLKNCVNINFRERNRFLVY